MKSVSVAMAAYNSEKYIIPQIESILNQLKEGDELVISLNPSTDNTVGIIQKIQENDRRVKLIKCSEVGFRQNFNSAILGCSNEIIFLSDHDDVWLKNKVDVVLKEFERTDADLVMHGRYVTDENLAVQETVDYSNCKFSILSNLIRNNFCGCCMAFKKDIVDYICPLPKKIVYHDMWIGLLVLAKGKVSIVEEPLMYYRRHRENESSDTRRALFTIIQERTYTMIELVKRLSVRRD